MAIFRHHTVSVLQILKPPQQLWHLAKVMSNEDISDLVGHVWSDLCDRLPGLVKMGRARMEIDKLPHVDTHSIPDDALWAAVACLGILAHTYRYEEKYDGSDGGHLNKGLSNVRRTS